MAETAPAAPSNELPTLVLVDQSRHARDQARDSADARLDRELGEGGRVRRFLNGIWKGNMFKEYYRQRYTHEALEEIQEHGNVLTLERDLTPEQRTRAIESVIERYQSDEEGLIETDAGERREVQADDSDISIAMKTLIRQYAEGTLNERTLVEERTRFLTEYRQAHGDQDLGPGIVTADNLIAVAQAARGVIEHGGSLDNALSRMQVVTGEARDEARTEARYNAVDRVIDRISRTRLGSVIGPETTAAAVAIASSVLRLGSHSVVGSVVGTVAPGVAAGLWAGLRENKRTKDERAQHSREMATGRTYEEGSARREQMEATRYESVSALTLTETLRDAIDEERLENGGQEALQAALDALVAVQARIDLSNERNIDLISYSNAAAIGDERMDMHRARIEVRRALEARLTDEMRDEMNIPRDQELSAIIEEEAAAYIEVIDQDIDAKDRAFRALKARRVAKAAAVGVATGVLTGIVGQEVVAGIDPTRAGLLDHITGSPNIVSPDGLQHQTVLEGMIEGDDRIIHTDASNTYEQYIPSGNTIGQLNLSNDHTLVENGDGTVNFVDGNGKPTIENLPINSDGSLPDTSIDELENAGFVVEDNSFDQQVTTTVEQDVSVNEYVQNHAAEATSVQRDLWYGNDTPGVYDQNELRVYRGGAAEAPGIIPGFGYQYTVAGMHPDGSWQGGESVDWNQAANNGNLFFAVSASAETQDQVFMIPIGPDGAINIPEDSPAGQFFSNNNGEVEFNGYHGEVVQATGTEADGTVHIRMLATMVGDQDAGPIHDVITTTVTEHHPVYTITTPGYDTTIENFTEFAPGVPIDSRRSLEALLKRNIEAPTIPIPYYASVTQEQLQGWVNETPDRLKTRRKETGPDGTERWVEADGSPVERNVDRERSALSDYIEAERARDPEYVAMIERLADGLAPMEDECRVAINVPAWMEEKNLYHFLNQFTFQVDPDRNKLDPNLYEVNVIVNRKEGTPADGSVDVIERFIQEYERQNGFRPKVNYIDIEFPPENANVGHARKVITDVTALRSLRRTGQTGSLYFESEDADVTSADPRTVFNLIDKFDKNPHLEALRGVQDRDPGVLKENDYLFMRRRVMDFWEILARQKRFRDPTMPGWNEVFNRTVTGGWNTGYTAESYANIGGYDNVVAGEDMAIGQRISMVRGDGVTPNLEVIGTVSSRSDSSPRRYIQEVIEGKGAYDDFGNEEINRVIREKSISELMGMISSHARLDASNEADFASFLKGLMDTARSATGGSRVEAEAMTRRILFMLGFDKKDYRIRPDGVHINKWDNFKSSLDGYRARWNSRRAAATT